MFIFPRHYIVDFMSLRDVLRFTILACIFVTPFICLYVPSSMFFPFISGKNFAFRILVEIMLGAWVLLMFIDETYRPRFSWVLLAAGAFLIVLTLADFFGVNPYRSFWSNYERMEGLIAHIHLFLYFVVMGSVIRTELLWRWFWRTSLGVSLLVAVNAFWQLEGWGAVHQSLNRLDATFGNSTYLAVYALFNFFIALFLFVREEKENPRARFVYPVIAVINLAVLYYTQTRGASLGLVGGVFLAFLLAALFDREHPERKKYAIGGVIGIVILVGAFIAGRNTPWIQENRTLGRIADISLSDPTTESRFMIWNMSWQGFKEHPILGWGQDNFLYVFSKYYDPRMWNQEPWFDRSHDVFFDWLTAGGALGLLTYLSLFGAALYYLWLKPSSTVRPIREADLGSRRLSILESGILTGMLAGYFVHNIFVFDNITSYLIFFGFLAYVHSQSIKTPIAPPEQPPKRGKKESELEFGDLCIAATIIIAITAGTVYFVNVRNIYANIALIDGIRPETILVPGANGQKEIAIKAILEQGLFGSGEAREQLGQLALQVADPRVPEEIRQQFYELTASEFDQEIINDPTSLRTISFAAAFYERYGQFDKAVQYYKKAIALSPKHQGAYLDLSQMLLYKGNITDAVGLAKVAYELDPNYAAAAAAYVSALVYQKNLPEADRVLAKFQGTPLLYDNRLVNAYGLNHYYGRVVEAINEKIAKGNALGRDYFTLAGGYSGMGDTKKAIAAVKLGIAFDASLKAEGEQLLEKLVGGGRS